jgi:hypothetical protein
LRACSLFSDFAAITLQHFAHGREQRVDLGFLGVERAVHLRLVGVDQRLADVLERLLREVGEAVLDLPCGAGSWLARTFCRLVGARFGDGARNCCASSTRSCISVRARSLLLALDASRITFDRDSIAFRVCSIALGRRPQCLGTFARAPRPPTPRSRPTPARSR